MYVKKKTMRLWVLMALASTTLSGMSLYGAAAYADDAMPVYDLGSDDVYDTYEAPKEEAAPPPEPKAAEPEPEPVPEEQPPQTFAGGQVSTTSHMGALGDKKILDVPFNVVGISSKTIEDQQAANVSDVTSNDPSVSDQTLSGASSAWNIRGFKTTQQDVQWDGIYGVGPRFYSGVEAVERVDIIKGPSALLGGLPPNGTVGGTINFVPKRAEDTPTRDLTVSLGSGAQLTEHLDVGQRTKDGKYGVRVNVLNRGGGHTVNDDEREKTTSVNVALDTKGDRYRASLDLGYVYDHIDNPQYRVTFGSDFLKNVSYMPKAYIHSKFGAPGTYRTVVEKYGVFHGEYDLNKDWTAFAAIGLRDTSMDYLYNTFQLTNKSGKSTVAYNYNNQVNKADTEEIGIRGKVKTGDIKHELVLSADRVHYTRYMANRKIKTALGKNYSYTTNFYDPQFQGYPSHDSWAEPKNDETTLTGVALTDILSTKDDAWQFIIGGRFQRAKLENFNNTVSSTANKASSSDETVFSPSYGIVHKMGKHASIYANYMQGLEAGETVTDTNAANYGQSFAPYKTKQYEIGTKFDFGKYTTTLSAFDIREPSLIENELTKYYELTGEVRHRGIEWNIFGEPKKGTRILGGVAYLDAKYTNSQDGQYNGNQVAGTSRWTATMGLEQDIKSVPGLTFTTRMIYNSSAYANAANTLRVAPWTRWDVGARYSFKSGGTPMTVRFDVLNVLNRNYWHALENAVYLGQARTYLLSFNIKL